MRRLKVLFVIFLIAIGAMGYLIYDHGHDQLVGIAITEGRCNGIGCDGPAAEIAQNLVDTGRYSAPWKAQWCLGVEGIAFFEGGDDFVSKIMSGVIGVGRLPCGDAA